MKNLKLADLNVKITKSARSKNIRLRVDKTKNVHLSMPVGVSERTGLKFVQDNLKWIESQLAQMTPPRRFKNNLSFSILGQNVTIRHTPDRRGASKIENGYLYVSGQEEHLHRRVRDFIGRMALPYIQKTAYQMAEKIGEKPTRITLKDTSSRWGSCSSAKHLNFCWKLALAPDFVLNYIIAHEVSHLKEMNHSDKFWSVVASLDTRRADAEIWLRKHGADLQTWE